MKMLVQVVALSAYNLLTACTGLEFVSQLCVQDEERTAMILAVSRKCAYMHSLLNICTALASCQILRLVCGLGII